MREQPRAPVPETIYVDKHGQVGFRYLQLLSFRGRALAVTWPDKPKCDACGNRGRSVRLRGYHDEGIPMKTCAACGGPEDV